MIKKIFIFCAFCCFVVAEAREIQINIICNATGKNKGLQVDQKILRETLTSLGCQVIPLWNDSKFFPRADINIFCEHFSLGISNYAQTNWFIPNPEWCYHSTAEMQMSDLILCRTQASLTAFKNLNLPTFFLEFTCPDFYRPEIAKDFNRCIHVAGGSEQKGTWAVTAAWIRNPRLPHLTVLRRISPPTLDRKNFLWVSEYIAKEDLIERQNRNGIHLCPSETEGFGHYIMEAMACGAVVVTTDAPPMNEFITDSRCLVPYSYTAPQLLATNYYISAEDLEHTVKKLLLLPKGELMAIGQRNRINYLKKRERFEKNLRFLLEQWIEQHPDENFDLKPLP